MDTYGKIDSKFRFVILASKRAKQLLRGSKPKLRTKTRNLIRIAQLEVQAGTVEYDILPVLADEEQPVERVLPTDETGDGISMAGLTDEPELEEEEAAEPPAAEPEEDEEETDGAEEDEDADAEDEEEAPAEAAEEEESADEIIVRDQEK